MTLKVDSVSKFYGQQKALDNISFEAGKGEIVALLGPNGAGKSTMMRIIACYLPQSGGQVSVCGFDVDKEPIEVRKRIGYLPENNPLYPDMYVREYLFFIAGLYKLGPVAKQRVEEMMTVTGLTDESGKIIGKLSKGYRQRVGLAQALIHDPDVLILDEPTSGLDPNQLTEIRRIIKEAGKTKTVLLSTHIMQEVEAICNRVMIINKGQIKADAPTSDMRLMNRASRIILVGFDKPIDLEALKSIEGVLDVTTENGLYKIFARSERDVRHDVFDFAVRHGLVLLSMSQHEGSLEEIFRELTL